MASTDRRGLRRVGLPLALVAAAALFACGEGGPSAETVAVKWRQALEKGDYETTWDLEGPNMRAPAGKAVAIASRKKDRFGQPLSPERAAMSIKAAPNQSDLGPGGGWIYLQVDTKDPAQSHLESVGLALIDGKWRVERSEPSVPHVGWVR